MPYLIGKQQSVDFVSIIPETMEQLPEAMQAAAHFIAQWQGGQQEFEIKTSGSTGQPKAILWQREKMEYSATLTGRTFGIRAGDTLLCCLNVSSTGGLMMVVRALVLGCDLIITEPTANPLPGLDKRIDFASFVPLQMEAILQSGYAEIQQLNRMKAILLGGAPIGKELAMRLQRVQAPIFQTYSMTETYSHVATRRINGPFNSENYTPLEAVKLSLDTRGCLIVESPITNGLPLITNDLAEIMPDGSFKWLGRWDQVINSGGVKISIEATEENAAAILKAHAVQNRFFLSGIPDKKLGQQLVMVMEGEAKKEEILIWLREGLPHYHSPKELFFVTAIALTHSGKMDKKATLKEIGMG
jgi:O-succinylbenzoic acid--CoA ligase